MTVVAIHQPNFFPWLGYFDKLIRSDVFIFLDDVQLQKTGGTWSNRVKLLISGEAKWVTGAIDRNYKGVRNINDMHFLKNSPWKEKMQKSINVNYANHPYYAETMEYIKPLLNSSETNVAEYNIRAVTLIAQKLGINSGKFKRSSDYSRKERSNELLCSLTRLVGGDTYLCGGGADGYQDQFIFQQNNINLCYQNFYHPVYHQLGTDQFVPGLSIIDALMNIGIANTAKMLKQ
ncbi:MAG: WbqC family protein [Gammaproteobacteria bacterium]